MDRTAPLVGLLSPTGDEQLLEGDTLHVRWKVRDWSGVESLCIDHKAFGRGRVMSVKGDALEIRFDRTHEIKKLLVGYAPIVKIRS